MHAGSISCPNNCLRIYLGFKPGDVVADASGQQLNCLRQVADVTTKLLWFPLVKCCAVELNPAANWRPDADQKAGKRRFPGSTWSNNAKSLSPREGESGVLDDKLVNARWCSACCLDG